MTGRGLRAAGPAGLILAGLCLLLPFLSASCDSDEQRVRWQVTYTGTDLLTGGRPDIDFTDDVTREPRHRLDDAEVDQLLGAPPPRLPRQPVAWLAAALLVAALAATALPSRRWRTTATAGLALAAAIVLAGAVMLARPDAIDAVASVVSRVGATSSVRPGAGVSGQVRDLFRFRYGFWTAIALTSTVAVANIAGLVAATRRTD